MAYAAAPVPETAKGVSIPQDKGYVVEEIKDGLYWVTEGAYTVGYLNAHDVILSYDFDQLVSGHWGRLATRDDVKVQKQYMQDIQDNAGKALQTVDFYAIANKVGYANTSLLFESYLDAVSKECARLTEPQWIKKLGGVDVWTKDHCYEVVMALRLD